MKRILLFLLVLGSIPLIFSHGIHLINSIHLDENYNFISNIFNETIAEDNLWSEFIFEGEIVRVSYESNLTNGSVIDVYVRDANLTNARFEIYHANTKSPLLGTSDFFNSNGEEGFIELSNLLYGTNEFDFKIIGSERSYLEFDYIHDATRYLMDINLTASSNSVVEGENFSVQAFYETAATGGPAGDIQIGLNDTNNNVVLDNSCSAGEPFQVSAITQTLCDGCTDNGDGTITFLDPNNGELFNLIWNLTVCPDASDLSPANLQTYEITATAAILDNSTGDIIISGAPILEILYPVNGSTYNFKSLFIRTEITGNSLDACWYDLNGAGNLTYNCSVEPNITAVEGLNNLSVYVNNTLGLESSDSINFNVNSSIPLTIGIISPVNGSSKTESSPQLKLLAFDTNYSSINYTLYIYYSNDTLYSVGNNGTLVNNTETEMTLSPALTLIGNITTYKIIANATDGINNATSNILFYTLTKPAIDLVDPAEDMWDADGNINFSFKVYDEAFTNISCFLSIDDILNQTNSSSLTGGVVTTFDVAGISEGVNKVWEINCTDAENNSGVASRTFNVDKTNPVVNSVSETPDPVDAGEIINITTNVTDNFGIDYVTVNISGTVFFMLSTGSDIYYYEYNTTGLNGDYNYSVKGYDNVGNFAENDTGTFNVNVLSINLEDYYGLNSSLGRVDEFNTSNLEEIEYMELNFSLFSFDGNIDAWYLNFSANGTNGCSLGNKQSSVCYIYPNWIQFMNNTNTSTYDGTQGNQGDRIQVVQTGSGENINLSIRLDEHYNPNVFKWYGALYNFSDVKWQNDTYKINSEQKFIKIELNQSMVPLDADQYKLDFRVQHNNPSEPLEAYACNSSYTTGHVHDFAGCSLVAAKYPSELQDIGTKFRAIFTKNLIDELGDLKYIVLEHHSTNDSQYYAIKTYNVTAPSYTTHWEFSNDTGSTWINSGDGYETELNINWFYDGADPTAFVYRFWANTTNGTEEYLEGNITWQVDPVNNYPPLADLINPLPGETITLPQNITFTASTDPNDDPLNVSLYLYQGGSLNKTLVTDLDENDTFYFWNDSTPDGTYDLVLEVCELGTSDLFCANHTHSIIVDNAAPQIQFVSPTTDTGNFSQNFIVANVTASNGLSGVDTVVIYLYNSTGLVNFTSSSSSPLFINFTGLVDGTYFLNATANDSLGNENLTETRIITLDTTAPQIQFVSPTIATGNFSQNFIVSNVTANGDSIDTITVFLYNSTGLVNSTLSSVSSLFLNFTGLGDGNYFLNATANDSSGNENLTETRIITLDTIAPKWYNVSKNETTVYWNSSVKFNASWTNTALAGYIFSTNQSGSWVNSSYTTFTGMSNVSENISVITANAGTNVGWYFFANDSAGNANQTDIQLFTVQISPTSLLFSINETMTLSGYPAPSPNEVFIPFQVRYLDNFGQPISGATCNATNNVTSDVVELTYNSGTGNYTGQINNIAFHGLIEFNATCSAENYYSASNTTETRVWWLAYLWDDENKTFGLGPSIFTTTWFLKIPNNGSLSTQTNEFNLSAGNNEVAEFPFCGAGANCTYFTDFDYLDYQTLRMNVSVSNDSCSPYICLLVKDRALNTLSEECTEPQAIPANTPTVIEGNLSANITVKQTELFLMNLKVNCSAEVIANVSVFYNYTGAPANIESHNFIPYTVASSVVAVSSLVPNYTVGPNSAINTSIEKIILFNNSGGLNALFVDYWFNPHILPGLYPNSIIPNTSYTFNSTGDLLASDNVSAGAPSVLTVYSNNQINWITETIPAGSSINETLRISVKDSLRNVENLTINNSYEKQWDINVFTTFSHSHNIQNVSIWTNYSTYGVVDGSDFNVTMTTSQGTTDISGQITIDNITKTLTFPAVNFSDVVGEINYTITVMVDTCTYSESGNWEIDCSDNCSISSNVDLLGNNISIIGFGSFITTANITNFTDLYFAGVSSSNRCEVYCSGGGCFV